MASCLCKHSLSSSGWWLIDVHGELGWAPASFLILKDEDDADEEEEENEGLVIQDKSTFQLSVGIITLSPYYGDV